MKSYATFFLIALMSIGLVFLLVTREREKHDAPAEIVEVKETLSADAGLDAAVIDAGPKLEAAAPEAAAPAEKPLRVTTLGWDIAAPGVFVPKIELAPEATLADVAARLARGGDDPQGADVAIMPLPSFIATYEKLRALDPKVFFVVGYSHGREEVHATAGALMKPPPGADEVKLVTDGNESATTLALFALDVLGVAPTRLRLLAPDAADAKGASFAAVTKGTADARPFAFSTADASRLVPLVAVAPKAVLDGKEPALQALAKAWIDGEMKVAADVPGIARRLAAKESLPLAAAVGGAPEAVVIVERLGLVERATLESQRPAVLAAVMARLWSVERGAGLTTNAAPDPLPTDARITTAIAPSTPEPSHDVDAGAFGIAPAGAVPIVALRSTDADPDVNGAKIQFLASVFDRAIFKITAKGGDKAAKKIAAAAANVGVPTNRLVTAPAEPQGVPVNVDVLSPP